MAKGLGKLPASHNRSDGAATFPVNARGDKIAGFSRLRLQPSAGIIYQL
ncbi:hypothetical protein ABIE13_000778 [Ottowia thiooxydans]|uniref:Uncharacterized protein n=1 Tax=Ottowia thiooxydans TaxID=219182 RepID=A0ABV2Q3T0_9BURK